MRDIRIETAITADLEPVRRCAFTAFAPYIPRIGREPAPMLADYDQLIAEGLIDVARDPSGDVLGFLCCRVKEGAMLLETVAVTPPAMGKGIGRALITRCEEKAAAAGLDRVVLYTNAAMTENLRLYPKLGYVEQGRWSEHGFDRVFFEKRLA